MGELPDVGAFGAAFSEFVEAMSGAARGRESPLVTRIRAHLGADPKELPTTSVDFAKTERPNLQLALEAALSDVEVLGLSGIHPGFTVGLTELLSGHPMVGRVEPGPVQYTDVEVGGGRVVRCVSTGIFLARFDGDPVALVLSAGERPFGSSLLRLEAASPTEELGSRLVAELRAAMREHNVHRGQVISLHSGEHDQSAIVRFHDLPRITRDDVVLPEGTAERIERHAIGIATHASRLKSQGRHLKRGILLHGPPGTGKTLTVNSLLAAMPVRTTVLLTGSGLGLIEEAVAIARELTPATVVLEDIDLVAAERTMPLGDNGILFDLLNQMEGLAHDDDLLFLLTTNRADLVEPALATRPGRVDLAIEIPLPDAAARTRLMRLYAGDVPLDDAAERELVERTEGLSGAFIKELMRQAALRAALEDRPARATDATAALSELLEERSTLTRRLLGQGGESTGQEAPPFPAMLHAFGASGIAIPPG